MPYLVAAGQMFPALREELMDEVCALNIRGETDGAVARGESPAQVECDCGGVTRVGMTGGIIYFSSLNTEHSLGIETNSILSDRLRVIPGEAAVPHQTGAAWECLHQQVKVFLILVWGGTLLHHPAEDWAAVRVYHARSLKYQQS